MSKIASFRVQLQRKNVNHQDSGREKKKRVKRTVASRPPLHEKPVEMNGESVSSTTSGLQKTGRTELPRLPSAVASVAKSTGASAARPAKSRKSPTELIAPPDSVARRNARTSDIRRAVPASSVVDDFMYGSTAGGAKVAIATEKSGLFFHGRASSVFTNAIAKNRDAAARPAPSDSRKLPGADKEAQQQRKRRRQNTGADGPTLPRKTPKKVRPLPEPSELMFAMERRLDHVLNTNIHVSSQSKHQRHDSGSDTDIRQLQQETLTLFSQRADAQRTQYAIVRKHEKCLIQFKTLCEQFDSWLTRSLSSALVDAELTAAAIIETEHPGPGPLIQKSHQAVDVAAPLASVPLNKFLSFEKRTYSKRKKKP